MAGPPMEMVEVPVKVFDIRAPVADLSNTMLIKHTRPPVKKDLGKNVRRLKPFPTARKVVDSLLSVSRGMPEYDTAAGIQWLRMRDCLHCSGWSGCGVHACA